MPKTRIRARLRLAPLVCAIALVNVQTGFAQDETAPPITAPAEQLPMLEGVGAFLSIASGLRSMSFEDAGNSAIITSFTETLNNPASGADLIANIQPSIQFMKDRIDAINQSADLQPADPMTLKTIGYILATQSRLSDLGFSSEEVAKISEGVRLGLDSSEDTAAIQAKIPNVRQYMVERQASAAERILGDRKAEMAAFLADIATQEGVEKDPSGFYYKVERAGTDPKPTMADTVEVHYKGTLIDGTQFDSSYDRGEPSSFPMTGVIKGFSGGLTKIGTGGKVIIYIPSDLGYGDNPRPGGAIRPGDSLIFECELITINP